MENSKEMNEGQTERTAEAPPAPEQTEVSDGSGKKKKKQKRKVTVINVPKRRKPLRTPSHIIRLCLVWSFVLIMLLLTYPFLSTQLYISDDLEVTPDNTKATLKLATQEEINAAEKELQAAIDGLVEAPKEEESSQASGSESSAGENSEASQESSTALKPASSGIRSLSTAHYNWSYNVSEKVDITALANLIDKAMTIDRSLYTEETTDILNTAVIKAQKTLCATVIVSQNAWQMMIGGPVKEAFGVSSSVGDTIMHSIFSFAFAVIPVVCFLAASFDKRRHIKHVIIMIGAILALVDFFIIIYPFVGIGAVLSIIMYVLVCILNIASIYAKQQEDHIVKHPEEEPEFSEKHPQFVKALLNEKAFGTLYNKVDAKAKEYNAAKNAQKHYNKQKKGK